MTARDMVSLVTPPKKLSEGVKKDGENEEEEKENGEESDVEEIVSDKEGDDEAEDTKTKADVCLGFIGTA